MRLLKSNFFKFFFLGTFILFSVIPVKTEIPSIKGLYNILKNDDIGFGQALFYSNWIRNFWDYCPDKPKSPYNSKEIQKVKNPVWKVVRAFWFHAQKGETLNVNNQNIIIALDEKLFGELMGHIYTKEIFNDKIMFGKKKGDDKGWVDKWRKSSQQKKKSVERKKIRQLINNIRASLKSCRAGNYMPRTTEAILWAFFMYKYDSVESLRKAIHAMDKIIKDYNRKNEDKKVEIFNKDYDQKIYDDNFFNENSIYEKTFYKNYDNDLGKMITKSADLNDVAKSCLGVLNFWMKNYDKSINAILNYAKMSSVPPAVSTRTYTYKKDGKIAGQAAICFEASMLDLFSILWYNPKTKEYDDSLLPKEFLKGEGFKKLKKFMKDNKLTSKDINNKRLGQFWFNLLSERSKGVSRFTKLTYSRPHSDSEQDRFFELKPDITNFINVINFFYGLKIPNYDIEFWEYDPWDANLRSSKSYVKEEAEWFKLKKVISKKLDYTISKRSVSFLCEVLRLKNYKITIKINDQDNNLNYDVIIDIQPKHVSFNCAERDRMSAGLAEYFYTTFESFLFNRIRLDEPLNYKILPFYTMMTSWQTLYYINDVDKTAIYNERYAYEPTYNLKKDLLNLVFYSLNLNEDDIRKKIMSVAVKLQDTLDDELKRFIVNLAIEEKDEHLIEELYSEIYKSKKQNKDLSKKLLAVKPTLALKYVFSLEKSNFENALDFLISKGADVDFLYEDGLFPLIFAITSLEPSRVKYLLGKGAKFRKTFSYKGKIYTLLRYFIQEIIFNYFGVGLSEKSIESMKEMMKFLVEKSKGYVGFGYKDIKGKTILDILKKEIKKIKYEDKKIFLNEIYNDLKKEVETEIEMKGEVESVFDILKLLGKSKLEKKDFLKLKKIIKPIVSPYLSGDTLLHYAVKQKNKDVINWIFDKYPKFYQYIDIQNSERLTPLRLALKKGYKDIAEILIYRSGGFYMKDEKENTLLHLAVKNGHTDIVDFILERFKKRFGSHRLSLYIEQKNKDGKTSRDLASKIEDQNKKTAILGLLGKKIK